MPHKRTPVLMFLILALCCLTSAASEVKLVLDRPQQGTVAAGKTQSYVPSLNTGEYVQLRVETRAAGLGFTVYGPSGSKVRGFYVGSGDASVDFVVEATGWHHAKADWIKDFQSKANQWTSANFSDVHVATFGSTTAVTHYKFTYDATFKGTHRARPVICSDTWVNDSGTWKLAATHCSVSEAK